MQWQDRTFIVGRSNSGKSHLGRALFESARGAGRRLVVDPRGSSLTRVPGAVTFHDPRRVPDAECVRFVPRDEEDLDAYNDVYRWALYNPTRPADEGGGPVLVWTDELDVVFPLGKSPTFARRVITQGRKLQVGHIGMSQRPVEIHKCIRANVMHVVVFDLPDADDRRHVAKCAQVPTDVLERYLAALPEHGFVWIDVTAKTVTPFAPLPA